MFRRKKFPLLSLVLFGLVFVPPSQLFSAAVTSVQSGDWNNPATWGGTGADAIPKSSDDVTLSTGHVVILSTGGLANFGTLAINGKLLLKGNLGSLGGGEVTIENGGILEQANTVQQDLSAGSVGLLTIKNGGILTHAGNTDDSATGGWVENAKVNFKVKAANIEAGGQINADGKGFKGSTNGCVAGKGPGGGAGEFCKVGGGGGAHAGSGGNGKNGIGGLGGQDLVLTPTRVGSGGGTSGFNNFGADGGDGGGGVLLEVTGDLSLNGTISVNGMPGKNSVAQPGLDDPDYSGGGGSAGTIFLKLNGGTLGGTGSGKLLADGGNGGSKAGSGGGGGGGYIVIKGYAGDPNLEGHAYGGSRGTAAARNGGAGIIVIAPSVGGVTLLVDNGDGTLGRTHDFAKTPLNSAEGTLDFGDIQLTGGAHLVIPAGETLTLNNRFFQTPFSSSESTGKLRVEGNFRVESPFTLGKNLALSILSDATLKTPGGADIDLTLDELGTGETSGTLELIDFKSGDSPLTLAAITIKGLATHAANGASNSVTSKFKLQVKGDFTLTTTGRIDVTDKGYPGGAVGAQGRGPTPGKSGANGAGGGGKGGEGGDGKKSNGDAQGSGGGIDSDPKAAPVDHGSGGGASIESGSVGGIGGGSVELILVGSTGKALFDGPIKANGGTGLLGGGGGAGGAVSIDSGQRTLTGTGQIQANGGNGSQSTGGHGGGGGGGRVAVTNFAGSLPGIVLKVDGGSGSGGIGEDGGVGTKVPGDGVTGVTLVESDASTKVTEGGTTDSFTLALKSKPTAVVTIDLQVDAQLSLDKPSVAFAPDASNPEIPQWDAAQTVVVTAVDDSTTEGNHNGQIAFSTSSSDTNYNQLTLDALTVAVTDNDLPGLKIVETDTITQVTEGGDGDELKASLLTQPAAAVTVTLADAGGQVNVDPVELVFDAQNWNTPKTVVVTAVNDPNQEGEHNAQLSIGSASDDASYQGLSQAVTVKILDNDSAGVTITQSEGATDLTEGGGTDSINLVLNTQPSDTVTVTVTTDDQVHVVPESLEFTIDNWNTPQAVTLTATDDTKYEGATPHQGVVSFTAASNDSNYQGVAINGVTAEITDNDVQPKVVLGLDPTSISEHGGVTVVTATLSHLTIEVVTVALDLADGATVVPEDFAVSDTTITIPAGQPSGSVTVTGQDDSVHEGNELAVIVIKTVTNGTEDGEQSQTLVVVDDDCAAAACSDSNACTDDSCDADNKCAHADNTNPCDDGSACTTGDVCGAGVCGGTAKDCSNSEDVCQEGFCNAATGNCEIKPKANGVPCDDGDLCTDNDACTGGACGGGSKDCSGAANACNDGVCNPGTGACEAEAKSDGTGCDDSDACTAQDACVAGVCGGGATLGCSDLNPCTADGCDSGTGCTHAAEANGTLCSDGDFCTTDESCTEGVCGGGVATDVSDGVDCTVDGCDEAGDQATHTPNNGVCSDGTFCNGSEVCDEVQGCQAGPDLVTDDGIGCTADACDEAGDQVTHTPNDAICGDGNDCTTDSCSTAAGCESSPVADGTSCSDGSACTQTDSCQSGSCAGDNPVVCIASDQCHEAGSCNPATGQCSNPAKSNGASCDDGNACTENDQCGSGACSGSAKNCDDGNQCTADSCAVDGQCAHAPITPGGLDDGDPCTVDSCDPATGLAVHQSGNDGASCNDSNACTQTDSCQSGSCVGSNPVVCTASDACHEVGVCQANGSCSNPVKSCDDNDLCTTDSCDAVQGCQHTPVSVDDDNDCTADTCVAGAPVNTPLAVPTEDPGTCKKWVCQPQGGWVQEEVVGCVDKCLGVTCTAFDQCHEAGTCDQATGACSNPAKADGSLCNDGNVCTEGDRCAAGSCQGATPKVCDDEQFCNGTESCDAVQGCQAGTSPTLEDDNICTSDSCNEATNQVDHTPIDSGEVNACGGCKALDHPTGSSCTMGQGVCVGSGTYECDGIDAVTCNAVPKTGVLGDLDGNPCTDQACDEGQETTANNSASCNDGNACTQSDSCQAGSCAGTNPVVCTASDSCHDVGLCDAATGQCSNPAKADGASCADDLFCNGSESCQGGTCVAGISPEQDQIGCTQDTCDEATDQITHTPDPTVCGDNNACTTDTCDLTTGCQNLPVSTDDGNLCTTDACDLETGEVTNTPVAPEDDNNPCTSDLCNSKTGLTAHASVADQTSCSDDLFCNGAETCQSGTCVTGTAPALDDGVGCTNDSCDEGADKIVHATDDSQCDDNLFCNGSESCNGTTGCQAGSAPVTGDGIGCTVDACDEAADQVTHTPNNAVCSDGNACTTDSCSTAAGCQSSPVADGSSCSDDDACTQSDSCQSGSCTGTNPVSCTASDQCHGAGVCDPATGLCSDPALANGTACNDSNACTQTDSCQSGSCAGANPITCTASDQCHNSGSCDPATGSCSNPAKPDGTGCSDGQACTEGDQCSGGACVPGADKVCVPSDVCHLAGTCQTDGSCSSETPILGCCLQNSDCDDGLFCNGSELCQQNKCVAGSPQTFNDNNPCTDDACDEQTQQGKFTNNTASCDDGSACTDNDSCSGGVCSGTAKSCDDGNPCTDDSCDASGGCQHTNNTVACDDDNACTQSDSCQAGSCVGASPVICSASDQCHAAGTCDPATGTCSNPAQVDGTGCNDNQACTTGDVCNAGVCGGAVQDCSGLDNACNSGVCNTTSGQCEKQPVVNGTGCDDSNLCTANDICTDGLCNGASKDCSGQDAVCKTGTCNETTGLCESQSVANGTGCDDTDACTVSDACQGGQCQGSTKDTDKDGTGDCAEECDDDPLKTSPGVCGCGTPEQDTDGDGKKDCQDNCASDPAKDAPGVCGCGTPDVDSNGNGVMDCVDKCLGVICIATDQCHEAGSCDTATGQCSNPAKTDSSSCTDGNACTVGDACTAGLCTAGATKNCNDGNVCTTDSCNTGSGQCQNDPIGQGILNECGGCGALDPKLGDPCSAGEGLCIGTGTYVCNGTEATQCNAQPKSGAVDDGDGNVCTGLSCQDGKQVAQGLDGTSCTDADACTQSDSCQAGICVGASPVTCSASDQCHNAGSCDPATGQCSNPVKADASACDDGSVCTTTDACAAGQCVGSVALNVDDGNACTDDSCDAKTGAVHTNNTASCNDGSACTTGDSCANGICGGSQVSCSDTLFCNGVEGCDAATGCQPGSSPVLDDKVACTTDSCDEVADQVVHTPVSSSCDDGKFCNGAELCHATLGCQSGTTLVLDDGIGCTADACDEAGDQVTHTPDHAVCDDNNVCTTDTCSATGGCGHTPLADGTKISDDGNACTQNICQGGQPYPKVSDGTSCDDGAFCTIGEICTNGTCGSGNPKDVDDGVTCTKDACDEAADKITHTTDDGACDDAAFCNGAESCDAKKGCQAGLAPATGDGVACTTDLCDEAGDRVTHTPVHQGCDDGKFCNGSEICHATLGCQAGSAPALDDGVGCTADSCDEQNDRVVHTADSAPCDDGLFCNGVESCNGSTGCQAGAAPALDDKQACTTDTCNESSDTVVHTPNDAACDDNNTCTTDTCGAGGCEHSAVADGTSCADTNPCNGVEACQSGQCAAGTPGDCDDGNTASGDGCSAACAVETGFTCTANTGTATSVCQSISELPPVDPGQPVETAVEKTAAPEESKSSGCSLIR